MGTDVWMSIAPSVAQYVETLIKEGKFGISAGTVRIVDISSGCSSLSKTPCGDRFKLVIPYAGCFVTWEVIFNCHYPEEPPDIILGDENSGFEPEIGHIKSLVNWNHEDPHSLLHLIQELLQEYQLYQNLLIHQNDRMNFEYESLIETSYHKDDIEVNVGGNRLKAGPINFLLRLPIEFSRIPPYLIKDNPGEDTAILLVTFQADGSRAVPQLYLSPRVEHVLGGSAKMRIPGFPEGGCLLDYVPHVCQILSSMIDGVVQGYEKKKEYIGAFLSHFGRSLIEYDAEGFTHISFLMEWHDFYFTIIITVPMAFPSAQPIYTFQSIYHESVDGRPYSKSVHDYPYSPRWSGNEMAERARAFILDYIKSFQRASVADGQLGQR